MMETWEVLEQALARIEGGEWVKENAAGQGGRYCSVGAMAAITSRSFLAGNALAAVIGTPDIGYWNDHPSRTKEEVVAAFQTAIRNEKAKAGVHISPPCKRPAKPLRIEQQTHKPLAEVAEA